jgi:AraC-like DNA-binding protein
MDTEGQGLPEERIQQEYRQAGWAPLRVRFFPAEDFETVVQRPAHVGTGAQRTAQVRNGVFSIMSRLVANACESRATAHHPGYVSVFFNLSARPFRGWLDETPGELLPGDTYVTAPQSVGGLIYSPHCTLRILNLFIAPGDFADAVEDAPQRVSPGLTSALTGVGGGRPYHAARMTPEMRTIVDQIDACPFRGSLKRLYLEGKILELLALRFCQLSDGSAARQIPSRSLRLMGHLEEARAILRQHMQQPPSLHDLSREVAMSASLLKTSFREAFGETVFGYLRNLRLDRAREMLLVEGVSVKEAAWAVGYGSLSHFARAFRQRFGASPRAWARTRMPS